MAEMMYVSAKTRTTSLAGSIAKAMRECTCVELRAVGAGAVNQVVKAFTIARNYVMEIGGFDLVLTTEFEVIKIEGEERTSIVFIVMKMPKELSTI